MAKQLRVNLQCALLTSRIFCTKLPGNNFSVKRCAPWEPSSIGKKFHTQDENQYVMNSPLGEMEMPDKLFHDAVNEYSSVWGKKTAVKCARSGRKYSFNQLKDNSRILAAHFQNKFNLAKGDVVAVALRNCPEYPMVFLATSQCGGIMTTVNPVYTPFEIKNQLVQVRPKIIVTDVLEYQKFLPLAKDLNITNPLILVKATKEDVIPTGAVDLMELFDQSSSGTMTPVDIQTQDTVVIPFSSGTSGKPKGVLLSHKNLVSNLTQLAHPDTSIVLASNFFRPTSILGILPMCHIFGLVVMTFFTIKEGARLITLPGFEPREFVKTIYWHKTNIIYAVPPLIKLLSNEAVRPRYLKRVQYVVNGASRYSLKDAEIVMAKCENIKVVQGYGLTESSPALTHTYSKRIQKLASIGVPIASTKLRVVSLDTGENLPARKEGELYAFGPQIMKGYLDNPEETKKTVDPKGWLKTGDLAYYDEDGDFYIVDRVKELIKVSGFQVSPSELEETIKIHPKVKDVVVIGVPNEKSGEVPKAFVIPVKKGDLTAEEVIKFVADKLSGYKQLKGGVEFVDEFPKSHTGKILRGELKKKG